MDISQMYQLLGLYSGLGSGYGLYGNYGNYNSYGQNTFGQILKNTAAVSTSGGISTPMDGIFEAASKETGVDIRLLKAVGKAESNFNTSATSRCGAMGVMQLECQGRPRVWVSQMRMMQDRILWRVLSIWQSF